MKAIYTKYLPASNTKPSRIVATAEGGPKPHKVTISYPHELDGEAVFAAAATALCRKMNWSGSLIGGGMPKGGYCFVFANGTKYPINDTTA